MSLAPIPSDSRFVEQGTWRLRTIWQTWLESVNYWLRPLGQNGATAGRPVDSTQVPLYIGQPYFDTTLGKPIWVKSRNPTVWCDATGAAV